MPLKSTPGPWLRKPGANDAGAIHGGPEGRGVASVHYQEDSERYEANARLIAAAPEMLDILKRFYNREDYTFREKQENWLAAKQLLTRIEG